mmetsp:Transcript_3088/g.12223  ORF Transcript_3088/g.12223 Transcript_3088/m.12223 type:complete len:224 (+) Transcript_3088:810-1481(+)
MRRVVYEHLALGRRQRPLQRFVVDVVLSRHLRYPHSHRHRCGAEDGAVADVPREERLEEHALVPRGERRLHGRVHGFGSRAGDEDVTSVGVNRVGAPGGPVVPRDRGDELGPAGDHGVLVTPRVGLVEERPGRSLPGGHVRAKVRPSLPEVEDARELGERGDLRPYLARARVSLLAPRRVAEEARGVLVHGGGTRDVCAPRALNVPTRFRSRAAHRTRNARTR